MRKLTKKQVENYIKNPDKCPLCKGLIVVEEIKNEESLMFTCEELATGKQYSVDLLEEEGNEVLEID